MALEIDWREPPLSLEDRVKAELKKNPGRWARIKTGMKSATGKFAWRKEGFDAESAPSETDAKLFDIYVRWPAAPTPTTASKTKTTPVNTKDGAPIPAAGVTAGLQIPTSGDVSGGYLASRSRRGIPADGADTVRPVGHNPSPVRP